MIPTYFMPNNPVAAVLCLIIGLPLAIFWAQIFEFTWEVICNPFKMLSLVITAPLKLFRKSNKVSGGMVAGKLAS
ncbi:MAG: hypothetical protein ABIB93_03360 [Chloroflexota bacterium]